MPAVHATAAPVYLRRLDGCPESRLPERVNGLVKFAARRPPDLRDLLNARFENLEGARRLYGAAELGPPDGCFGPRRRSAGQEQHRGFGHDVAS